MHTHYDNLKVARSAPPEVIRAAYKSLAQKYHPDKNPSVAESHKIMQILNGSFQVLNDPVQRAAHDRWISQQETGAQTVGRAAPPVTPQSKPQGGAPAASKEASKESGCGLWYIAGLAILIGWAVIQNNKPKKPYSSSPPVSVRTDAQDRPAYVRPALAPNGAPWPIGASEISGYKKYHSDGYSEVTVDNSRNSSDVFVKLVSLDYETAAPVRHLFIPAFSTYTCKSVRRGTYDIRYRDLETGGLSKSEEFAITESKDYEGVNYTTMTLTLYKVQNGNMQTYTISEDEF